MAYGVNSGGASGLHPGKPVIWPEGKPVEQVSTTAQTGQVKSSQSVQTAPTAPNAEAAQVAKEILQQQQETVSAKLNMQDLTNHLMHSGIRPTDSNMQTAILMLQNGLELSPENFANINKLMQGNNANNLEAAILIASKKLSDNPIALPILAKHLQQSPKVSQQNQNVQMALQNFMASLQTGNVKLPADLMSQLSGLTENWQKLFSKASGKNQDPGMFLREEKMNELHGFRTLLKGTLSQIQQQGNTDSQQVQNLMRQISQLEEEIAELMKNYTAQAILSKTNARPDPSIPDKFAYWQIPNSMTNPPSDLEILIQRDSKKKNKINPNKTTIVMKMQTDNLGELAFEIKTSNRDVAFRINTESDNSKAIINRNIIDLKNRMETQDFKLKGIQVVKNHIDIKKVLIPALDLDNLVKVRTTV